MSDRWEQLREAAGGAWDGIDVMRWTCRERHDEGCACTGIPNDDPEFAVGDEGKR